MSVPHVCRIDLPVEDFAKLEKLAPVKRVGNTFRLFGIWLRPNRTLPPKTWAAMYSEGAELCLENVEEPAESREI